MLTQDLATSLEKYAVGRARPATFLERGVSLPFTTPLLLGGRIRPAERGAAELVLANPAGVGGVYVLPWSGALDFCTPSLHDRALWSRVSELPLLVPRKVREAAQRVACEGYAGREAARAAQQAAEQARRARMEIQYGLLLGLVRQGEQELDGGRPGWLPPEGDAPANVRARAEALLGRLRRERQLSVPAAIDAIEALGEVYEVCGLRRGLGAGRLPALAASMAAMVGELAEGAGQMPESELLCRRLLAQSAELVLRCGRLALEEAHGLADDMLGLVTRWLVSPASVRAIVGRPEWIFDGWEMIAAAWHGTPARDRRTATLDMARLVPLMPSEVRDWVGFDAPGRMDALRTGLRRWRRSVAVHEDWMTGRIVRATFRAEQLRALCA